MLVAGKLENIKDFSQFNSIREFNKNIKIFLAAHTTDFTKSELIAFKRLVQVSAKNAGVTHTKIETLVKRCNKKMNGFGISRSTFERMLLKAKNLGILLIKNTEKSKGGKGYNIYIFKIIEV